MELRSNARVLSGSPTFAVDGNDGSSTFNLIEPPYTERYVRWCERTADEIIICLLLALLFYGVRTNGAVLKQSSPLLRNCASTISPDTFRFLSISAARVYRYEGIRSNSLS